MVMFISVAVFRQRAGLTESDTLRKVCHMTNAHPLQPTLWRTCRVIANRTRLQILALLLRQPGQTVSAVAAHLGRPLSLTSLDFHGKPFA